MVLLAAVFGALIFSSTIGVFGSQISAHLVFPAHELARYISVAGILERMELYLVTVWIAGVVVKLNIFVHSCCIAAASTLGLQDYRRMIIPVVITATAAGEILYSDYLQLVDFLARVWPFYGFSLELLLPALILLAAVLRKKGGGRVAPGKNP
jgi:spore germination protein KB